MSAALASSPASSKGRAVVRAELEPHLARAAPQPPLALLVRLLGQRRVLEHGQRHLERVEIVHLREGVGGALELLAVLEQARGLEVLVRSAPALRGGDAIGPLARLFEARRSARKLAHLLEQRPCLGPDAALLVLLGGLLVLAQHRQHGAGALVLLGALEDARRLHQVAAADLDVTGQLGVAVGQRLGQLTRELSLPSAGEPLVGGATGVEKDDDDQRGDAVADRAAVQKLHGRPV